MKSKLWLNIFSLALLGLFLVACGKKDEVDTAALEKSFQNAEPTAQSTLNEAVTAIKAGNYAGAGTALQKLAAQTKVTPEQQQTIKDVMAQIQKKIEAGVVKMTEDGKKAMDDVKKALPKP